MSRKGTSIIISTLLIAVGAVSAACGSGSTETAEAAAAAQGTPRTIDLAVNEGTSMAVAVSPDGSTLAFDLQGTIWTVPTTGGAATRLTDFFNDARQPTWSPDGKTIAFFAYRDGGYDIWAIAPDGSNQRKLTWGPYDDREPAWSHDGTRIAFSSDRREWPPDRRVITTSGRLTCGAVSSNS